MTQKNEQTSEHLPLAQKELCPNYCPFLQEQAFYCRLFNIQLMASPPLIYKCYECMNSDTRKSTYKAKVKDFEKRVQMWDKAAKKKAIRFKRKNKNNTCRLERQKSF